MALILINYPMPEKKMKARWFKRRVTENDPKTIREFCVLHSKLNEELVHKTFMCGGVWYKKNNQGKLLRIRHSNQELATNDYLEFYFDPKIQALPELTDAECLFENNDYGIWIKDAGVLAQGSEFGDHASLLRLIETKKKKNDVYLIHRLDREVAGLMIFAYNKDAARYFSELFKNHELEKIYLGQVKGRVGEIGASAEINHSLDGKSASTFYRVLAANDRQTLLEIKIKSGRFHQIRRHLEHIGHPLLGDPLYGRGNKNEDGLKLWAKALKFLDFKGREKKEFFLPDDFISLTQDS